MAEDRLFATFRSLDGSVDPDADFGERLFETLAVELGYRAPVRGRGTLLRRLRPVFALAAAVALLLAFLVGLLFVGSRLAPQPSVEELITRSQRTYDDLPPFAMTVRFDDPAKARFLSDGTSVRFEIVEGNYRGLPAGSWILRDGEREVRLVGSDFFGPSGSPVVAYADLNELTWMRRNAAGEIILKANTPPPLETCPEWQHGGSEVIAGRAADVVACGDRRFWVDRGSGLVVRFDDGPQVRAVVTELDMAPSLDPALFAFEAPPGYVPPPTAPPIGFAAGDLLPGTNLSLVEGGSLDTGSLRGRPAAIYLWCPCAPGPEFGRVADAARDRTAEVKVVVVALADADEAAGAAAEVGYEGTLAVDPDMELVPRWKLGAFPALVLLDADGRLAGVDLGRFSEAELSAKLDLLVAGRPIPEETFPPADS
jgi:hypothetical protein